MATGLRGDGREDACGHGSRDPPPSVARDRLPWLRHTSQGGRDTPHPCPPPDSPPPAPPARTDGENHKGNPKVLALSLTQEA